MKRIVMSLLMMSVASMAMANVEPTVTIVSAEMRPGTTLMDVVYRVDDADDATLLVQSILPKIIPCPGNTFNGCYRRSWLISSSLAEPGQSSFSVRLRKGVLVVFMVSWISCESGSMYSNPVSTFPSAL
jgi:hypothetical protein